MSERTALRPPAAGRSRLLAIGVVTSTVNRAIAVVVPLLVIPLALRQLGLLGYGAWAIALSVTSLVSFADLGIGTGLMTRLAADSEVGDVQELGRKQVASAYAMITVIATLLLVTLLASATVFHWADILGTANSGDELETIFLVTVSAFLVNMVASLVIRVEYAVGQQGRANLWQAAGSLCMLGAVWLTSRVTSESEPFIIVAAFTPVAVAALNSLVFFGFHPRGRSVAPKLSMVDRAVGVGLLRLGSKFFLVSLLVMSSLALDPLIVAHTSALAEVANYAIPYRLFAAVGTLAVMAALPLWPLNADAVASGDVDWIRRTTKRMTVAFTAIVTLANGVVLAVGPSVVNRWLGDKIHVDLVLWSGLAAWWIVQTVTGPAFMVQNGAEVLRPQIVGFALLLIALPVKVAVATAVGYAWIPWVGVVLYGIFIWPACRAGYLQALGRARRRPTLEDAP